MKTKLLASTIILFNLIPFIWHHVKNEIKYYFTALQAEKHMEHEIASFMGRSPPMINMTVSTSQDCYQ